MAHLAIPTAETPRSFRHGVHPAENKHATEDRAIERMPFVEEYILPLNQHLGAPSRAIVEAGQVVQRGQKIADAGGFVSIPLHAPVTGRVRGIERRNHPSGQVMDAIVIERDPASPQTLYDEHRLDWLHEDAASILAQIRESGMVGLGGAAFPTHVKMLVPEGKRAEFFLVNGCECEPFLTCDHRVMLEHAEAIMLGIRISLKTLGAKHAYIGIEDNKPNAIAHLRKTIPADLPCEVIPLKTKYPQGAEKMLVTAVFKKEIPRGKLPLDLEIVVNNISTVAALGDLATFGQPLIERVVTITGPGIRRPSNLLVPIGTPLKAVLDHCGGLEPTARQILFGGPMMGRSQRFLDVPITKGTSGILCLTDAEIQPVREFACIRCLSCVDACPVFLNPCRLGALARVKQYDAMEAVGVLDCMECGSCSYVCPSNIPLVQRFRVSKALIREQKAREKQAQ